MQDHILQIVDVDGKIADVTVRQYDNLSRLLCFQIFDGTVSVDTPVNLSGHQARMYVGKRKNGHDPLYIDGDLSEGEKGVVSFLLPCFSGKEAGEYRCEIRITDPNEGSVLSLRPFTLTVEGSVRDDEAIEASGQFSALDNALIKVDLLSARVDQLTALPDGSTAGNAELADIRVGADGKLYNSAGNAVRGQVGRISGEVVSIAAGLSEARARIDSIAALPDGSTTADAELVDIRIDSSGDSYPSAGDAVRSYFDAVRNSVVAIEDDFCQPYEGIILERGFISSSGEERDSLHAVRSSADCPIEDCTVVVFNPNRFEVSFACYSSEYAFERIESGIGEHPIPGSNTIFTDRIIKFSTSAGKKYRLRCYSGSDTLEINTAQSGIRIYRTVRFDEVQKLRVAPDINDYVKTGVYYKASTVSASNAPVQRGGYLIVKGVGPNVLQRYITNNGMVYMRSKTSAEVWSKWIDFSEQQYSFGAADAGILRSSEPALLEPWTTAAAGMKYLSRSAEGTYTAEEYGEGVTKTTFPYSSVFYCGGDILINRTPATFYSAVKNPYSVVYTRQGGTGDNKACYYGIVCSTLAETLVGDPIYKVSRVLNGWDGGVHRCADKYDTVSVNDISDLRPGMILSNDSHMIVLSDVYYNNENAAFVK